MTTTQEKKIKDLERQVELLRSAVIGFVKKDPEGEYRPEFEHDVFGAMNEAPEYEFTDKETFLKQLRDTDA